MKWIEAINDWIYGKDSGPKKPSELEKIPDPDIDDDCILIITDPKRKWTYQMTIGDLAEYLAKRRPFWIS